MTANEMFDNFQIEYDRVASLAAKGFEEPEVAYFLNSVSIDILREWENKPDSSERDSYITPFLKTEALSLSTSQDGTNWQNSLLYDYPEEFSGRALRENVFYKNCSIVSNVSPISDDEFFIMQRDITRQPTLKNLYRLFVNPVGTTSTKFELMLPKTLNFKIDSYRIVYLREPRLIVINTSNPDLQVNSEFTSLRHWELVRRAVFFALETAGDPRIQTFPVKPMGYRGTQSPNLN
jgi:hypothetical protein